MDFKLFQVELNDNVIYMHYCPDCFSISSDNQIYYDGELNLTYDYSYVISAINCVLHHPYFKFLKNNYYYVENEKFIEDGLYPEYDFYHISNNALWNVFKNHKQLIDIIKCFKNINYYKVYLNDNYKKCYPNDVLCHLLYYLNNNLSIEFYLNKSFIRHIKPKNVSTNDCITEILNELKPNSIFIKSRLGNPFKLRKSYKYHPKLNEKLDLKQIKELNNKLQYTIDDIIKNNKINSYNYLINSNNTIYYLQSFVFIDKDFNCVYVKLKYDDNLNVIKKVRYFNDDKVSYDNIDQSLNLELNLFSNDEINDYYSNINFYKIDLVCYVKCTKISANQLNLQKKSQDKLLYNDVYYNCRAKEDILIEIKTKLSPKINSIKINKNNDLQNKLKPFTGKFYPWQQYLFEQTKQKNDRYIFIVCDPIGNKGKTFFCSVMKKSFGAFTKTPRNYRLSGYSYDSVVLFNISRLNSARYRIVEDLDNVNDTYHSNSSFARSNPSFTLNNPRFVGIFTNSVFGLEIVNKYSYDNIRLVYFKSNILDPVYRDELEANLDEINKYDNIIIDDTNKDELIICNMTDLLNQLNIK